MTAPYTQDAYADWKRRFQENSAVGGLLRYAKATAGIGEEQPPQMPGLLQQAGAPPQAQGTAPPPPLLQPPQAPREDPTHAHREGLLGKIRHFFGADRISREHYDLLEPDQRERLLNMSMLKQIGDGGEADITDNMVALRDAKRTRDRAARNEARMERIQKTASKMPPQEAAEYVGRMATALQLPGFDDTALAAERLRPRDPMQVGVGNAVRWPDGTYEIPAPQREPAPPRARVAQVRTRNQSGDGVVAGVNEETGEVYWELPAPPTDTVGRPPTEAESKDYVYAGLMRNAMPDIRATADSVRPEVITALRMDPLGVSKIVLTDNERVFWRAVLEFAAAANRKESGAQITPAEVANTLDRYVDTGFDGPPGSPVRRAKANARENYLRLLDRTSSRARNFYDGGGGRSESRGKPMTPEAYRAAKAEGYTDEEIIAEGYTIPER